MPLGDFVVCLHRTGQPNVLSAKHNVATPCIGNPRRCKEEKSGRENMLVMLGLGGKVMYSVCIFVLTGVHTSSNQYLDSRLSPNLSTTPPDAASPSEEHTDPKLIY